MRGFGQTSGSGASTVLVEAAVVESDQSLSAVDSVQMLPAVVSVQRCFPSVVVVAEHSDRIFQNFESAGLDSCSDQRASHL